MLTIRVIHEIHDHRDHGDSDTSCEQNNSIHNKLDMIMDEIKNLKQEVTDLKAAAVDIQDTLDIEQEQLATLLQHTTEVEAGLNARIAELEGLLANAVDPAALQEVIDSIKEIRDGLITTKADLAATIADGSPQ